MKTVSQLVAYDYDKQQYIQGEAARVVLIKNLEKELAVWKGPRAEEYAAFRRMRASDEIPRLEAMVAELKAGAVDREREGSMSMCSELGID